MAARWFINGGVDNKWSTSSNWSATDGGFASGVKPTASDDVHFSSDSPNCVVDTAGVALTIDFTGAPGSAYANTITMTAGLTISGSVTLTSGMTIAGTSGLTVGATATLTSNAKVWPNALTLNASVTYTLADNWTVNGLLTLGTGAGLITLTGNQMELKGGLTVQNSAAVAGSTTFLLSGTGTITPSPGTFKNNFTINTSTAPGYTFAPGSFFFGGATFTCIAGTVNASASTLSVSIAGVATTLQCAGITWNAVEMFGNTSTITLAENLNCSALTVGSSLTINGNKINVAGNVTFNATTNVVTGTTVINVTNTSTLNGAAGTTSGGLDNPIIINAPGKVVTIGPNTFRIKLNKFLVTAGTVVTDAGSWSKNIMINPGMSGGLR